MIRKKPAWYRALSSKVAAKSKYFFSPYVFALLGRIICNIMYPVLKRSAGGKDMFAYITGFKLSEPLL